MQCRHQRRGERGTYLGPRDFGALLFIVLYSSYVTTKEHDVLVVIIEFKCSQLYIYIYIGEY